MREELNLFVVVVDVYPACLFRLQRNKRTLIVVVVEVLINIKCKYKIARSCMGTCRDKQKTRVDSFIRGAGPLSIPSLKVKCGGVTHSLSPKSFSFNGITKQRKSTS